MPLGNSICLIAFGAALKFAVHAPNDRLDIGAIGVIVMIVGILSLFLSPADWNRPARWGVLRGYVDRTPSAADPVPAAWDEPPLAPEPPRRPAQTSLRIVDRPPIPQQPERRAS